MQLESIGAHYIRRILRDTGRSNHVRIELNKINAKIKRLYVQIKRNEWNDLCSGLDSRTSNGKLWKLLKNISNEKLQAEQCNTILSEDKNLAVNEEQAANLLGLHYQKISRLNFSVKNRNIKIRASRIVHGCRSDTHRGTYIFNRDFRVNELEAAIGDFFLNKAPGPNAYLKDWCNNQRLRRNSPFSQRVSFNLTIGDVESHHLLKCLDPVDDLDGVFFHPELSVHVNKQTDLPAYLKQLTLERIGDIPIECVQVYADGSRDDYYRSGSGIYIKSQDQRRSRGEIQMVAQFFAVC
ncbi:UNVERIFIED_CONTAM: hypothetical protein NCL1_20601 [Trichonephila clavipes]